MHINHYYAVLGFPRHKIPKPHWKQNAQHCWQVLPNLSIWAKSPKHQHPWTLTFGLTRDARDDVALSFGSLGRRNLDWSHPVYLDNQEIAHAVTCQFLECPANAPVSILIWQMLAVFQDSCEFLLQACSFPNRILEMKAKFTLAEPDLQLLHGFCSWYFWSLNLGKFSQSKLLTGIER